MFLVSASLRHSEKIFYYQATKFSYKRRTAKLDKSSGALGKSNLRKVSQTISKNWKNRKLWNF